MQILPSAEAASKRCSLIWNKPVTSAVSPSKLAAGALGLSFMLHLQPSNSEHGWQILQTWEKFAVLSTFAGNHQCLVYSCQLGILPLLNKKPAQWAEPIAKIQLLVRNRFDRGFTDQD